MLILGSVWDASASEEELELDEDEELDEELEEDEVLEEEVVILTSEPGEVPLSYTGSS